MKVVVTGGGGQLGTEMQLQPAPPEIDIAALDQAELDITSNRSARAALRDSAADVVVNTAAYTAVDKAESEPELAFAVNRDGAGVLARACQDEGIALVHVSTDFVFDGRKDSPYNEDDPVKPINVYGASKAAGEDMVRRECADHLILRTAWVYSPFGHNFMKTIYGRASGGTTLSVVNDQIGTPTAAADIARAILQICGAIASGGDWSRGTFHYASEGRTSWYGFAARIVEFVAQHSERTPVLQEIGTADYPTPASRPANSQLDCTRIGIEYGIRPPAWEVAADRELERFRTMHGDESC